MEMNNYNYIEGIEFHGLIPEIMNAEGIKTIGAVEKSVKFFGFEALGSDPLEIIDVSYFNGDIIAPGRA